MGRVATVGLLASLLLLAPRTGSAQQLGGEGESCRARSDCEEGLRCIGEQCVAPAEAGDEERDEEGGAEEEAPAETERDGGTRWADFELGGTHFFGGLTFAPGMSGYWLYGGGPDVRGAFLFGIRLGALFDRIELAVELAPATWKWDMGQAPTLSLNVSIGGYIRVAGNLYWPMRFGLGFVAVNPPPQPHPEDDVYMLGRVDLIGLAYQYGHLLFEVSLPSIRFHSEFQQVGVWGWLFNISISYVV